MKPAYVFHIAAGSLALIGGFVALYSAKGAQLHRRSGRLFVYTMLIMSIFGITIAVSRGVEPALNVPAGLLSAYLVVTALTAVRPLRTGARLLGGVALLVALAVGIVSLSFGFEAIANGGTRGQMPAFPFFMFGVVAMLASAGDIRMVRSGALKGAKRIARHLWRMSFALFIASLSFFIGQAKVIPQPFRIRPLLALPVLAVLLTMFYWMWRVRIRHSLRGLVGSGLTDRANLQAASAEKA